MSDDNNSEDEHSSDESPQGPSKKSLTQQFMGILGSFAVVWYLFVTVIFVLTFQVASSKVDMNPAQIAYIDNMPIWAKLGQVATVIGGLAGSVYFLLRRKSAYGWFAISLVGILAIMLDATLRDGFSIMGSSHTGVSVFVIIIGLYMFWTTYNARNNNQLK